MNCDQIRPPFQTDFMKRRNLGKKKTHIFKISVTECGTCLALTLFLFISLNQDYPHGECTHAHRCPAKCVYKVKPMQSNY